MRALSLWQPWASAVALGAKRIETRHWWTGYRGPLAIHAAARRILGELRFYHEDPHWLGALQAAGWTPGGREDEIDLLPFGAIVAVCRLSDVRPSESFGIDELHTLRLPSNLSPGGYGWTEDMMGDFAPGRFGWVLDDIQALPKPIPFRGGQGFFHVPDELIRTAFASEGVA